jgi:propanediol dehydratase small subunit
MNTDAIESMVRDVLSRMNSLQGQGNGASRAIRRHHAPGQS